MKRYLLKESCHEFTHILEKDLYLRNFKALFCFLLEKRHYKHLSNEDVYKLVLP